jgi:diguanylate cyclase (GGDEF)-like protein
LKNITKNVVFQALDCSVQALVMVDAKQAGLPIVYVNTAFEALTGTDARDIVGAALNELVLAGALPGEEIAGAGDEETVEQTWRVRTGSGLRLKVRRTALFERPNKQTFWLLTVLGAAGGESPGDTEALRDALHDAQRKLKRLERTDGATGVPNETAFSEILQRDWAIARREQRPLGVVVFQVDHLDEYRASLGRHATNSVLRKVAHAINGSLRRAGDFGARLDDDRFAVIIGSATHEQSVMFADRVAKKVHNLAIPHPRSAVARNITVSFGAASEVPEWSSTASALMEAAENRVDECRSVQLAPEESADETARASRREPLES